MTFRKLLAFHIIIPNRIILYTTCYAARSPAKNAMMLKHINVKISNKAFQTFFIPNTFGKSTENQQHTQQDYTPKNYHLFKVDKNRMQQCCAVHTVHSCQQYCSVLLHLIAG